MTNQLISWYLSDNLSHFPNKTLKYQIINMELIPKYYKPKFCMLQGHKEVTLAFFQFHIIINELLLFFWLHDLGCDICVIL